MSTAIKITEFSNELAASVAESKLSASEIDNAIRSFIADMTSKNRKSTRKLSLEALDLNATDRLVFDYLRANPNSSRADIAANTPLALQTVCGSCGRLLEAQAIEVTGRKYDENTNRQVQTLRAVTCT